MSVVADTINIAARPESLNREYKSKVILSETVYATLDENEKKYIRALDDTQIRGRENNLIIFESFAGYPDEVVENRFAMKAKYEQALLFFKQRKTADAKNLFIECKIIADDDSILALSIERCNALL